MDIDVSKRMSVSLRARVSRYPAKMVSHLASKLIDRYALCGTVYDPFCGSGELLVHAAERNLQVEGCDINPYAVLMTKVRLAGFQKALSAKLLAELLDEARSTAKSLPIDWDNKHYWYSPRVIDRLEAIRGVASRHCLDRSPDGRAILLAIALSARLCSRADERSPKPFISKEAIRRKGGRFLDPLKIIPRVHQVLSESLGTLSGARHRVVVQNAVIARDSRLRKNYSLIVTSPPYLNAQDYFRNCKLELYLLEGIMPFQVNSFVGDFVGTERGNLLEKVTCDDMAANRRILPVLSDLEKTSHHHAAICHRYFSDMRSAFCNIAHNLTEDGRFVLVCGDNLIAGRPVRTWACLRNILIASGWIEIEAFRDRIRNRALAPARSGHKGLIKEETVLVFRRPPIRG